MFDDVLGREQRMAIELQEQLGADSYQHHPEKNYATVFFENKTVEPGDFILPSEYDFVELEHTDNGTLLRTKV